MTLVCAACFPKLPSTEQKNLCLEIAKVNLEMVTVEKNARKSITCDEWWVYDYDSEAKQQCSLWQLSSKPRPKRARQSRSNNKSMLIVFLDYATSMLLDLPCHKEARMKNSEFKVLVSVCFDIRGIVQVDWVPQCQTVDKILDLLTPQLPTRSLLDSRPNTYWTIHLNRLTSFRVTAFDF